MPSGKQQRIRVRILVKAFPQHSQQYEETVCVAGIDVEARQMLRLYPIRFRRLPPEQQFERFDLVEMVVERPKADPRPESRHVIEDSIQVVDRSKPSPESKIRLWQPFVVSSLNALEKEQKATHRSFGVIRPEPGSLEFYVKPVAETSDEEQELGDALFQQQALFEDPLKPLQKPTYAFGYRFQSGGRQHRMQLLDWEVQAAYLSFQRQYGPEALNQLKRVYAETIPKQHPHFIMGNMMKMPWRFIVIGVLRSALDPGQLSGDLFA